MQKHCYLIYKHNVFTSHLFVTVLIGFKFNQVDPESNLAHGIYHQFYWTFVPMWFAVNKVDQKYVVMHMKFMCVQCVNQAHTRYEFNCGQPTNGQAHGISIQSWSTKKWPTTIWTVMMSFKMIGKRTCKGCDWKQIHTMNNFLSFLIDDYEMSSCKTNEKMVVVNLDWNATYVLTFLLRTQGGIFHEALTRAILFLINFILYRLPETVTMNSIQMVQ